MKSWRTRFLAGAACAAAIVAIPALSQGRGGPESLLPPGFGNNQALPPPEEKAAPPPPANVPPPPVASGTVPGVSPPALDAASGEAPPAAVQNPLEAPQPTNYFTVPEGKARSVEMVGVLDPGNGGLGAGAFGANNGAFLAALMGQVDAPLPSRWTSILLRRALLSRAAAPAGVNPVDWVAARADLLLRMGEADAARMLVQSVDPVNYTPRMIETAAQTALATADPAALCPLTGATRAASRAPVWTMAEAMCAALAGEPTRASALSDQARQHGAAGIDLMLAEKVIGAGAQARRAANVQWDGVDAINPWRFGLASATGTPIPAPLLNGAGPRYAAWFARAPMVPLDQRLDAAGTAAALGIFSSRSLVEAYAQVFDQTDPAEQAGTVAARLRTAWIDPTAAGRLAAMRALWAEPSDATGRYARLILTAGAASRIEPSADHADAAADLIASMLSAGMDAEAARWSRVVEDANDSRAWAMLAVGSPRAQVDLGRDRVQAYIDADTSPGHVRAQMLVAALAGLGRVSGADASRLGNAAGLSVQNDLWATTIDQAVRANQPGTVALLAATAIQTERWAGVPPAYLFRIVRDLKAVGLDFEARMIAAEAMARL
ncbi:hypothetical protein GCM10023232_03900 [Sphingosinicella ginsenosidimutans]|uniref:hypothetical protein n=1 Tax=Allosphingosinicella ginsenosidimutans TaxID=1176539 RepID=UPI001FB093BD|nr:hypothetical protein [Sphingosinicella ginsenosidimutans]